MKRSASSALVNENKTKKHAPSSPSYIPPPLKKTKISVNTASAPGDSTSSSSNSSSSSISITPALKKSKSSTSSFAAYDSASSSSSSSTGGSKLKTQRSSIYTAFDNHPDKPNVVVCKKCNNELVHTTEKGTGSMWNHLKSCNRQLHRQLVSIFFVFLFLSLS
jgi:hypothetical protein